MQSYMQMRRLQHTARKNPADIDVEQRSREANTAESNSSERAASPAAVAFDGPDDPQNPHHWPGWKKAGVVAIISLITFVVGLGSSISGVLPQASRSLHVSRVTESLATSLYLIGLGWGALFAGPLSEERGRNPVYLITFTLYCCWILGAALAPNLGAQLAFRFLAGVCGSTPFTVMGGTLGDIFDHRTRGRLFPFVACVGFLGPMVGPIVGGYVGKSGMDWRWAEWITLIISCSTLVIMIVFLPETDAKEILRWKAQAIRGTGIDVKNPGRLPLQQRLRTALSRPFIIFFTQPVIAIFTGYLTIVYCVAFCFFSSAQYIFRQTYGFSQGSMNLIFASISVGLLICALVTPLFWMLLDFEHARATAQGRRHAGPESMLWWALIGGPLLPISVFWMAWSARPSVSYWAPMISAGFFGFSMLCIFISTYGYIMHRYTSVAPSALVCNTFTRHVIGGIIVIVSIPMFETLGVQNALTIFAAISLIFTPLPYFLYFNARKGTEKGGVEWVGN